MNNLLQEIRRVQRRLAFQRFLGLLGWCWFASLLAAAIVIVGARFYPLGIVDWQWLTGLLAAGLIVAGGWTFLTIPPALQAALEIDRRFGLKERISSTLTMNHMERETEAGRALIADADARLRRVAVLEKFPIRPSRYVLLPLLPAVLLAAVMIFRPPMEEKAAEAETIAAAPPSPAVKTSADDLRQKLADRRKQADKDGLKDASELLKKLEDGTKELRKEPQREKALVKLNDFARELQARRKQLGSSEALKRQMEKVHGIPPGPAGELAKALAKSDFQKAAQALDDLQKKLADGQLDSTQKAALAKQIEQLKQQIDQMAQQAKDARAGMQKRADQFTKAGDANAAGKLEDEIQKLQQECPEMDALQNLANKLEQGSNQMQQGQNGRAAQSMQDALQQMTELARQQSELKTLDGAMEQLADAKRQMNCEQCGGQGCEKCQGRGRGKANLAAAGEGDEQGGMPGQGVGHRPGNGARSEPASSATYFDSRVRQSVGKGAAEVTGLTGGPNLKNQAEAEIQKAATAIEHGSTDPLSGQRLPRKQSENAREYFDSFREGK